MKLKFIFILLAAVFLLLSGCHQSTTWYLGAQADKTESVTLIRGEKEGQQWHDLYVVIDYSYKRDGDHFGIKGTLTFSASSKINYQRVRDLKLKLFFLDKNLRVVEYYNIARTLSTDLEQQLGFLQTLMLPKKAVAFTFGYEGMLVDEDLFASQIWNLPKRNGL